MRKNTLNIITACMVFSAIANTLLVLFVMLSDIQTTEKIITIALTDICLVWIARDFIRYRENSCKSKRSIGGEIDHY